MGAINETYKKLMSYQTPMIHMLFPQLVKLLEQRRQVVVQNPAHGDTVPQTVEYVERLNLMIMEVLNIPAPDKETLGEVASRKKEQLMHMLEEQSTYRQNRIETLEKALKDIILRLHQDQGTVINPELVQKLYQDIGDIAMNTLTKY